MLALPVPQRSAWEPQGGAIFNNPKGGRDAKFRIVRAITRAVQGSPRGATILMSAYLFDNGGTYDALVAAHRRGVHVQMVLDGKFARNGKTRRLARKFNRDNVGGPAPAQVGHVTRASSSSARRPAAAPTATTTPSSTPSAAAAPRRTSSW